MSNVAAGVFGAMLLGLLMVFVLSLVMAIPTYFLWNWLVPKIFGLMEITLFQAWGINFLSGMLFKPSAASTK